MIKLTDNLWVGDSADEWNFGGGVILNVAQDLQASRGWAHGVEYMQVGLVDGPGNPMAAYYAAVFALATLLKKKVDVLVCCHTGSRAIAVAMMYMNATSQRGWDVCTAILRERVDGELPEPHAAHRAAFDKLNWRVLSSIIGAQ